MQHEERRQWGQQNCTARLITGLEAITQWVCVCVCWGGGGVVFGTTFLSLLEAMSVSSTVELGCGIFQDTVNQLYVAVILISKISHSRPDSRNLNAFPN